MTGTHIGSERWLVYFFRRHSADDRGESVPGRDFLDGCPAKVRATMLAVFGAVADAPPPRFSGGGYWAVMRDEMSGYYEVRVNGPQRKHFRLFRVLERHGGHVGFGAPAIIVNRRQGETVPDGVQGVGLSPVCGVLVRSAGRGPSIGRLGRDARGSCVAGFVCCRRDGDLEEP